MDTNIIKDILKSHYINSAILIDNNDEYNIVICSMKKEISFEKWDNLENLLKYCTKKDVCFSSYPQAKKYLGEEYLKKGVIINA